MKLFGIKKNIKPNLLDSITRLREAEQNLEKREKHLEKLMNQALQDAKQKLQTKNKRAALFQMKKKKMYEMQLQQIFGKKSNIELQIMALENAGLTGEVITAMQGGQQALKQVFSQHKIEKVEDVMESINETMDDFDDLNKVLSEPIGPPIDEDDLAKELRELEESLMDASSTESKLQSDEKINNAVKNSPLPTAEVNSKAPNNPNVVKPIIVEPKPVRQTLKL